MVPSGNASEDFYIAPSINYQLDATIQSLFYDNSPITFSLVPFRFSEAGFKYRKNNLFIHYVFVPEERNYSKTISGYFMDLSGVVFAQIVLLKFY
jgi:hypothetical protein